MNGPDELQPAEDIAADALPPEVDALAVPIRLDQLQPWHRPRKQFVRERQWIEYSRRLLASLGSGGQNGPANVRYLTLPGTDYLDVRLLADVCAEIGCTLTSTAFLAAREGNPVRARAQYREESLKQAGHVTDNSVTFPSRLEEVATVTSQAYLDVRRRAPFDIINIDACGSIALPDATHSTRLLDAVHRLVELQLNTRTSRWLLFITTDARPESLSQNLLVSFKEVIRLNAQHSNEFSAGAHGLFGIDGSLSEGLDQVAADPSRFLSFYTLGLSKWLLRNSDRLNWEVKTQNLFCYSTTLADDVRPTMASLAFEFIRRPLPLVDQFGAANIAPIQYVAPENYSYRALQKTASMIDLDTVLEADATLKLALAVRTKALLVEAGYVPEALQQYDGFVGL